MGKKYKIPSMCMQTTNRKAQKKTKKYKTNNSKLNKSKEKIVKLNKMKNK